MEDAPSQEPALPIPTADELQSALQLIDPDGGAWHSEMVNRWVTPRDEPFLLPVQVLMALTVVSSRIRTATDQWLADATPEERAQFERERAEWQRVAKGELPSPGWTGQQIT